MIKVAIIGTGAIADVHIQAFLEFQDQCQIVTLVNDTIERAERKAERYGLNASIYSDWKTMLDNEAFDLASICLPPSLHAEAAVDVLEAGKHVLVEKPMATSLAECDAMLAAATASGRLLSIVAQNRYKNPMMKMKQLLDSGAIGRIIHAQVDSFWWRGDNYYQLYWRGTWEHEGGGCTMNHAVHHIDLFQWMMGMPQSVEAVIANLNHTNSEVEDFSTSVLRYDDGRLGQITASLVHHGEDQQLLFQGELAKVSVPWATAANEQRSNGFPVDNDKLIAQLEESWVDLPDLEFTGHDGQIQNVLAAVAGREELLVDGRQGRNAIELVMAIYQSGATGVPVNLPMTPDDPFYTRAGVLANAPRFHEKTESVAGFDDEEITLGSDYGEDA